MEVGHAGSTKRPARSAAPVATAKRRPATASGASPVRHAPSCQKKSALKAVVDMACPWGVGCPACYQCTADRINSTSAWRGALGWMSETNCRTSPKLLLRLARPGDVTDLRALAARVYTAEMGAGRRECCGAGRRTARMPVVVAFEGKLSVSALRSASTGNKRSLPGAGCRSPVRASPRHDPKSDYGSIKTEWWSIPTTRGMHVNQRCR